MADCECLRECACACGLACLLSLWTSLWGCGFWLQTIIIIMFFFIVNSYRFFGIKILRLQTIHLEVFCYTSFYIYNDIITRNKKPELRYIHTHTGIFCAFSLSILYDSYDFIQTYKQFTIEIINIYHETEPKTVNDALIVCYWMEKYNFLRDILCKKKKNIHSMRVHIQYSSEPKETLFDLCVCVCNKNTFHTRFSFRSNDSKIKWLHFI